MSLPQNMHTAPEANPAFCFEWVPRVRFPELNGRALKLTTCPHLMPRLRKSGVIPPLLPYTFMVYKEMTLPLLIYDFR